jgi:adenine phosphoribosyltransferase
MTTDFKQYIHDVPDFPSPGILFRDVTPLLASPSAFADAARAMAEPYRADPPDKILGIEARGFLFGAALAREMHVGIVPARKPGKLPRKSERVFYGLEYGKDSLEVHTDAFSPGERVLVVEDVLTTGGSTRETIDVVTRAGGEVVGAASIINRGGNVDLGVPYNALADVTFPTWPADQIPDWLAAIPLTKPGSRPDASKPM